jgi:hypothetical protein
MPEYSAIILVSIPETVDRDKYSDAVKWFVNRADYWQEKLEYELPKGSKFEVDFVTKNET